MSKQKQQETNEPFIPSMAIFSPSDSKDLLTNSPAKDVESPAIITGRSSISKPLSNGKLLRSSFEVIGKQRPKKIRTTKRMDNTKLDEQQDTLSLSSSSIESLPLLLPSPTKLNEAVFGYIKGIDDSSVIVDSSSNERKKVMVKMPSIINNGSLGKPLIKTSRSLHNNNHKRFYSTTNYKSRSNKTFDNIQLLREEQFDEDEDYHTSNGTDACMTLIEKENLIGCYDKIEPNKNNKTELPTIKDAYRSSKHNHQQHHQHKYRHPRFPKDLHGLQPHGVSNKSR